MPRHLHIRLAFRGRSTIPLAKVCLRGGHSFSGETTLVNSEGANIKWDAVESGEYMAVKVMTAGAVFIDLDAIDAIIVNKVQ